MLAAKGMIRTGEKINRVGQDFQMFLHFLTNSEIQNFYQIKLNLIAVIQKIFCLKKG